MEGKRLDCGKAERTDDDQNRRAQQNRLHDGIGDRHSFSAQQQVFSEPLECGTIERAERVHQTMVLLDTIVQSVPRRHPCCDAGNEATRLI